MFPTTGLHAMVAPSSVHPYHQQQQGVPPGFVEQLKEQMKEMAGTSEKLCNYSRACRSVSCPNTHPEGRDIEDDPQSVICRFGRRCKRQNCFYVHPAGRDLDEDPSKGKCKLGEECMNPACIYTHPDTRKAITQLTCFACGSRGHVARDCPKDPRAWHPRVAVKNFPEEWSRDGCEGLAAKIQEELEVFGQLTEAPEVQGLGDKVIATFEDVELAKQAIKALNGEVFDIDFCSPPPPPGSRGFGARDKRCTIFVGNLPLDSTEEELREVFSRVGVVESFRVVCDRESKKSKGYGFCDYNHPDLARDALKYLADVEVGGRRLRLCPAEESLGGRGRPGEGGERGGEEQKCEMIITCFPQRWQTSDLRDFLLCAIKVKPSLLSIEMGEEEGDPPARKATVTFSNESDAKLARQDLAGQKIAGKPLSISLPSLPLALEDGKEDDQGYEKKGKWWDKDKDKDKDWRRRSRSRERSRSRSWGWKKKGWNDRGDRGDRNDRGDRGGGWRGRDKEKDVMTTVFIDELSVTVKLPEKPCQEDVEVWVDPLPDEADMKEWTENLGEVDDVFRVPDAATSQPSSRGYVRFKDHASAAACVERGAGKWSESERWLSSQRQARFGDRASVYSENMISKILGTRGDVIAGLRDDVGAKALMLRGEGLGENDKMESSRVHFVCKSAPEAGAKLQAALEKTVNRIHDEVKNKPHSDRDRGGERRGEHHKSSNRDHYGRNDGRGEHGGEPWRPPGGDQPPPPPGWMFPPPGAMPPVPPGWPYPPPPWGPPPPGYPAPPWMGPPGAPPPPGVGPPPGPPPAPGMEGPPGQFSVSDQAPPRPLEDAPPLESEQQANGEALPRERDRERRRRREAAPEGEEEGGRRRRRRREGEEPTGQRRDRDAPPEGQIAPPAEPPPRPAPVVAPAAPAAPAEAAVPATNAGFLDRLPERLTPEERALGEAVLTFLRDWDAGDSGNPPNMVHLGGDARVREFKTAALPREVSLKAWLKQRYKDRVEVRGQSVVAIDQ